MTVSWVWDALGIPATREAREIKRAYFKAVKRFNPEDDPESFQRLRAAYETATKWAESGASRPAAVDPAQGAARPAPREAAQASGPADEEGDPPPPRYQPAPQQRPPDPARHADPVLDALDTGPDMAVGRLIEALRRDELVSIEARERFEEALLRGLTQRDCRDAVFLASAADCLGWSDARHPMRAPFAVIMERADCATAAIAARIFRAAIAAGDTSPLNVLGEAPRTRTPHAARLLLGEWSRIRPRLAALFVPNVDAVHNVLTALRMKHGTDCTAALDESTLQFWWRECAVPRIGWIGTTVLFIGVLALVLGPLLAYIGDSGQAAWVKEHTVLVFIAWVLSAVVSTFIIRRALAHADYHRARLWAKWLQRIGPVYRRLRYEPDNRRWFAFASFAVGATVLAWPSPFGGWLFIPGYALIGYWFGRLRDIVAVSVASYVFWALAAVAYSEVWAGHHATQPIAAGLIASALAWYGYCSWCRRRRIDPNFVVFFLASAIFCIAVPAFWMVWLEMR